MRYRTRNGKAQADTGFLGDVSAGISEVAKKEAPILLGPFIFLYDYIIGSYAYIARSFLRVKLGSRTFGFFTIFFITIFIWITLLFKKLYPIALQNVFGDISNENILTQGIIYFLNIFPTFFYGFISPAIFFTSSAQEEQVWPELSTAILILIFTVITMTVGHFIEVRRRKNHKELVHSFYRGDSLFFDKLEGKIVFGVEMTMGKIWMIVEPLSILIFALIIGLFTTFNDLAYILIISACCLFLEEYKVYKEDKELTYNSLDQLIDGKYIAGLQRDFQEKLKEQELSYLNEFRASLKEESPASSAQIVGIKSNAHYRARVL